MAVMVHKARFDPEAHLHKQGWKGKGTALKAGHATRPLAVVRKKNLGGIGKDRDEAVPFWDNIFATTAASIISSTTPSAQASPSATPGPSSPAPTPSWQSSGSRAGISTATRVSREIARRGLYSRFFRGTVVPPPADDETVDEEVNSAPESPVPSATAAESASSSSGSSRSGDLDAAQMTEAKSGLKGKEKRGVRDETKEERRARRAEKAARKEEKAEKKRLKEERRAKRTAEKDEAKKEEPSKRKRKAAETETTTDAAVVEEKTEKKKKRRKEKNGE